MNDILATSSSGIAITERQARIYAKRFSVEYVESNVPGVLATLVAYADGPETVADSFLFESPETRDEFKALREAFDKRVGGTVKPESEFSKVSILEVIPDWESFKETLPKDEAAA